MTFDSTGLLRREEGLDLQLCRMSGRLYFVATKHVEDRRPNTSIGVEDAFRPASTRRGHISPDFSASLVSRSQRGLECGGSRLRSFTHESLSMLSVTTSVAFFFACRPPYNGTVMIGVLKQICGLRTPRCFTIFCSSTWKSLAAGGSGKTVDTVNGGLERPFQTDDRVATCRVSRGEDCRRADENPGREASMSRMPTR